MITFLILIAIFVGIIVISLFLGSTIVAIVADFVLGLIAFVVLVKSLFGLIF